MLRNCVPFLGKEKHGALRGSEITMFRLLEKCKILIPYVQLFRASMFDL